MAFEFSESISNRGQTRPPMVVPNALRIIAPFSLNTAVLSATISEYHRWHVASAGGCVKAWGVRCRKLFTARTSNFLLLPTGRPTPRPLNALWTPLLTPLWPAISLCGSALAYTDYLSGYSATSLVGLLPLCDGSIGELPSWLRAPTRSDCTPFGCPLLTPTGCQFGCLFAALGLPGWQ